MSSGRISPRGDDYETKPIQGSSTLIQFVSAISGLFRELHRRRVFRVAAVGEHVNAQRAEMERIDAEEKFGVGVDL